MKKELPTMWGHTLDKSPDELADMLARLQQEARNGTAFVILKVSEREQPPETKPKTPREKSKEHREKKTVTPRPTQKLCPQSKQQKEAMDGECSTSPGATVDIEAESWRETMDGEGLTLQIRDQGTEPTGWNRWKISGDYTEEREEKGETDK